MAGSAIVESGLNEMRSMIEAGHLADARIEVLGPPSLRTGCSSGLRLAEAAFPSVVGSLGGRLVPRISHRLMAFGASPQTVGREEFLGEVIEVGGSAGIRRARAFRLVLLKLAVTEVEESREPWIGMGLGDIQDGQSLTVDHPATAGQVLPRFQVLPRLALLIPVEVASRAEGFGQVDQQWIGR